MLTRALFIVTATLVVGVGNIAAANSARRNYVRECLKCHGPRGNGGDAAARCAAAGRFKPRSLADCSWMNMMSDATLFLAIKDGGPAVGLSPDMPAWGGRLSDQDIRDLVHYIRSFCGGGDRRGQLPAMARVAISAH